LLFDGINNGFYVIATINDITIIIVTIIALIVAVIAFILKTDFGIAMRATGNNAAMVRALGVNDNKMKVFGLAMSNALTAFAGFLVTQNQFYADINMGIGIVITGLGSVLIADALKSVFSFDVVSLHSKLEQRHQYIDTLSDRFQRLQKSEENTDTILNLCAWIDMDEAIHSLVFIPPAERYSWWGKLQKESRRLLRKAADKAMKAGNEVRVKQLSGLYADVCEFSKDDLQLDCGGNPGEVLTCLRVYTKINQQEYPGRVIFRTLR
jgi:hypothetical protein